MNYYDIFPRMVPADKRTEIHIRPRFAHAAFPAVENLQVYNVPMEGYYPDGSHRSIPSYEYFGSEYFQQPLAWRMEKGVLIVEGIFAGEQEHVITVKISNNRNTTLEFRIYSLREDLYAMRPFQGDFHIHSTGSDGKECPAYVAANYRRHGFDFIAITDHYSYEPSLEAIHAWADFDLDFQIFPGEEVHAPDNPVHIVNFGGDRSVNALWQENEEKYRREVAAIQATLPSEEIGSESFAVAASEWIYDRIRESGGVSIFCHPYWYVSQYVISEALTSAILQRARFDAFEVIGGFFRYQSRSNNFQIMRWAEELGKGNRFPVVGLSDSHGTTLYKGGKGKLGSSRVGWSYTIVLAQENTVASLGEAIRDFRSVAVCRYPDECPNLCGDFRMVKYADFLLREYFPLQRGRCEAEGTLMLEILAGSRQAEKALKAFSGETARFRAENFKVW
jgi:hypothetical protein